MPREVAATSDCPPDAAIVDLLDGRLAEPDAARIRRHAERCSTCRALLDELTRGAEGGGDVAEPVHAAHAAHAATDDEIARALLRGSAAGAAASSIGRTVDRKYALVRLLGKGGMGEVYEAEHLGTGRRVAVKLIRGRLLERGAEAESRFRREARAAAATRSPHIVEVLDAGEDVATGDLYLVMELLRGEDLQHLIDRVGPLLPDVALRVAAQALVGLAKLHEAGTVHRDVKPANLFLAQRDEGEVTVKLLDFGIAKVTPGSLGAALTAGLTRADGLLGSPLYMSPEAMANSKSVDGRTDLWSLGSALYCALAGCAPLQHVENVFELLPAIRGGGVPPLRELAPWVSPETAEAVHRALAVDPEDRYPSAAAMLEAIRALLPDGSALREEMLAGVSPEARAAVVAAPPPERRGGGARLAVLTVVLLGVAAAVRAATLPAPAPASSSAPPAREALDDAAGASGPPPQASAPPASAAVPAPPGPSARRVTPQTFPVGTARRPPSTAGAPSGDPMREHQ